MRGRNGEGENGRKGEMNKNITYKSTNGKVSGVSFREALLKGLAADGGLFIPDSIPVVPYTDIESFSDMAYHEIAADIIGRFTGEETDVTDLRMICRDAYNFDIPLEKVTGRKYILRLDRGPTASFKDFAARAMSRLMQYFLVREDRHLTILTATSGDTGSAVANAFHGMKNIRVIVLYPEKEVSLMQRKQMTTLGGNINIVAVQGKFDDCQSLVKKAFLDNSIGHIPLSSANSINIGRLLPQTVYYFYAFSRLLTGAPDGIVFSVPSGNFGNLTAGLFAMKMGLPVEKFIISTNSNDEVPVFLRTGNYTPIVPSLNCISSAMNVGHPSNLPRIIALYGGIMDEKGNILKQPSYDLIKKDLFGVSVSDEITRQTIAETRKEKNIILEPHGAVAWRGITEYEKTTGADNFFISLETAHPAKFPEELLKILNITPPLPPSMSHLETKKEIFETIGNNYNDLRELILQKH